MIKRSYRFPRRLSAVLLVSLGAGTAQAQLKDTLNDTGQDTCYDGSALVPCTTDNTGDTATYPRQDGRFGRDAAATARVLPKIGGGAAGFDFTKVCMSGELAGQGSCLDDPSVGTAANQWACTKDNHTNLIWSLETVTGNWLYATTTYPDEMNATNRCGYNLGWRAPTRRELLSIVHYGAYNPNGAYNPTIDVKYFPNTVADRYWSDDTYLLADCPASCAQAITEVDGLCAWHVGFDEGGADRECKKFTRQVRLVHSGQ